MNEKTNCNCFECGKSIYRKPGELKKYLHVYCSKKCLWNNRGRLPFSDCPICEKIFKKNKKSSKYCSRKCANKGRRGITYSKKSQGNNSQRRLALLHNTFAFNTCMIDGCNYNKTYDIHRLIKKDGYIIGNMFAICPNHHAEIHRNIIKIEKINDYILRKV